MGPQRYLGGGGNEIGGEMSYPSGSETSDGPLGKGSHKQWLVNQGSCKPKMFGNH